MLNFKLSVKLFKMFRQKYSNSITNAQFEAKYTDTVFQYQFLRKNEKRWHEAFIYESTSGSLYFSV